MLPNLVDESWKSLISERCRNPKINGGGLLQTNPSQKRDGGTAKYVRTIQLLRLSKVEPRSQLASKPEWSCL